MTEQQLKKFEELMGNVEKYEPQLMHIPDPLRFSIAKYYPALKKLAEE